MIDRPVGAAQRVHAVGHYLQRVDVEARVGFVEHRQLRLEQRHLEDLVALLLAAGETLVHRAAQHRLVDIEESRFLLDQLQKLHRVELGFPDVFPLGVQRGLEEVLVLDAGDLHRVLEGHEHTLAGALVRIHFQKIASFEGDFPFDDLVFRMPGNDTRQRALAGAVRPHDGVHFARVHVQIDPLEDLLVFRA